MPLRRTLLYLSGHSGLRHWVENSAIAHRLSSRFIAGETLADALAVCRKLKQDGILATLDYLGENVKSLAEAESCRNTYLQMLNTMRDAGLEPNVSLKLTQFGLDLSEETCEANVAMLAEAAAGMGGFVRVDMESSEYTDRTLRIVTRLFERFGSCGTVIQSYLKRSASDVAALNAKGIRVRLCKGAYLEPETVAFRAKQDVDANYLRLAAELISHGWYPAVATHDEQMLAGVVRYMTNHRIEKSAVEFQMLYGIRRDLQRRLSSEGYRVRVYVPFGEAWYPYFMRRLAERPANVVFLARNLLR